MGLFSKIKKGLSKAWKGVKKVASKVWKGVKKVAKKVAYAIPGGKAIWKGVGKLGKEIVKGIGKLGPVGIMAAQVVLSATGIGAGIAASLGSMWSSFGAVATSAAKAGSILGSVAKVAYNAVNFVGGSLGAVGDAITQGASKLMSGSFSQAAEALGSNLTKAFTGEAGKAAVQTGLEKAAESALQHSLGKGALEQAITAGSNAMSGGSLANFADAPLQSPVEGGFNPDALATNVPNVPAAPSTPTPTFDPMQAAQNATPWYQKAGSAVMDVAKEEGVKQVKSLLSPDRQVQSSAQGYQPVSSYEDYYAPQQDALSAPTIAQGVQAVDVYPSGYYNPNQY